jgi:hypothetical protein
MLAEVFKDDQYFINSADNRYSYRHVHSDKSDHQTKIGIILKNDDNQIINSAIVLNRGFSSGLPGSWIIDDNILAVLVGNAFYLLSIPDLSVLSISEADLSTTFEIAKVMDRYIVHGELDISCFDSNGKKVWAFSGRDIFACIDDKKPFQIFPNHIKLIDFENNEYVLDFNGKLLSDIKLKTIN